MSMTERLWDVARREDVANAALVRAVRDGSCPRSVAQAYMTELAELASGFPSVLASIVALCPDRRTRLTVLANLLEEEGVERFEAHGAMVAPEASNHGVMALRVARALGAPHDAPLRHLRSAWMDSALARGEWLGALAFVTVGFEANVPPVFAELADGFRIHYGCSDEDLAYLLHHVGADAEHAADGIAVLAELARSERSQAEALEGARHGVRAWTHLHRKYAHRIQRLARA